MRTVLPSTRMAGPRLPIGLTDRSRRMMLGPVTGRRRASAPPTGQSLVSPNKAGSSRLPPKGNAVGNQQSAFSRLPSLSPGLRVPGEPTGAVPMNVPTAIISGRSHRRGPHHETTHHQPHSFAEHRDCSTADANGIPPAWEPLPQFLATVPPSLPAPKSRAVAQRSGPRRPSHSPRDSRWRQSSHPAQSSKSPAIANC
jgi:hypothetical protein